ncbi:MAG: sle1 [Phycisphaerales bacterium]|nr:sle1 [Phycisphaerales bacterium]
MANAWRSNPALLAHRLTDGRFTLPPHIRHLGRKLVDVALGRCPRLVISEPPRHAKSTLASHWFPAWYLSLFPANRVMLAGYEATFAAAWGRRVRNTIEAHGRTLGVGLSADSAAADAWETTAGGGMRTAGVGGPFTGHGGNVLIVDDPIKNSEEANSQTIRDKVWDWWLSTARTRLEPGGSILIVMTRWHEDDLVGRVLGQADDHPDGVPWEVLRLPALAEANDPIGRAPGEALWPDRYDAAALAAIRRDVGDYVWDALYQQAPPSLAGNAAYAKFSTEPYPAGNVDAGLRLVPDWPLQLSIDFNRVPGMHGVVGQHFPHEDCLTAVDEIHSPGMTIIGMLAELKRRVDAEYGGWRWPHLEVFGDASGRITSMRDGKSSWDAVEVELRHHGIPYQLCVPLTNPGVVNRVNAFNYALKTADDRIRYRVNPGGCPRLVKDFKAMRWDGNELSKRDRRISHSSDAEGYRVWQLAPIQDVGLTGAPTLVAGGGDGAYGGY